MFGDWLLVTLLVGSLNSLQVHTDPDRQSSFTAAIIKGYEILPPRWIASGGFRLRFFGGEVIVILVRLNDGRPPKYS
jgi:hypothetical protein